MVLLSTFCGSRWIANAPPERSPSHLRWLRVHFGAKTEAADLRRELLLSAVVGRSPTAAVLPSSTPNLHSKPDDAQVIRAGLVKFESVNSVAPTSIGERCRQSVNRTRPRTKGHHDLEADIGRHTGRDRHRDW